MKLADSLVEDIKAGRVVLILGAGASMGALDCRGESPPLGNKLRDLIADKFLGANHKNDSLEFVAELAMSETDIVTVQEFIADKFRDLRPASHHSTVSSFRWRGIATTNYDRVLEDAYAGNRNRLQDLIPFLSDMDRVDEKLRLPNHVAYLKLHGCITRTSDLGAPLILTVDQFLRHRKGRSRLYAVLKEWAYENPFVFVGHRLADYDLRSLLLDLADEAHSRPRFYLIRPAVDDAESRFWEQKRVSVLPGTFEDFLQELDKGISPQLRQLSLAISSGHPIEKRFRVREAIPLEIVELLNNNVEYVSPTMSLAPQEPSRFYKGFDLGWYAIEKNLDVRRNLTEILLREIMIRPEEDRPTPTELYAIKAEAGAGKTVFLRRLAWEAARDVDALCFFVRQGQPVSITVLAEIIRCTGSRIFLFWDDAADNSSAIEHLLSESQRRKLQITIFTAERANAWNMACGNLERLLSGEFVLRYLNHSEIESLARLLEANKSLGTRLSAMAFEERVKDLEYVAGRQILVALHEATSGRPFEETLLNEFNEIQPELARRLYLTICVLNRFNVRVRAGLIARIHGVPFSDFRETFFGPLEHVVIAHKNENIGDYIYQARHPEIAQIVFQQVLKEPSDRFNEYIRILSELNLAYISDEAAFKQLTRARSIHELFPDYQDANALFQLALSKSLDDPYILQQRANYERLRPNGNLDLALNFLAKAKEKAPRDTTIAHTMAEILRAQSLVAETPLRRERLRKEAKTALIPLLNSQGNEQGAFARHTIVKLAFDDLRELLANATASERLVDETIRETEKLLLESIQKHPDEQLFLQAEAEFGILVGDNVRALRALERAFAKNSRDPFIASRLASIYQSKDDTPRALETVRSALEANRGDRTLNFRCASLLRRLAPDDKARLIYHFRRSFVKWDDNYEAQFWFARYAFESDNPDDVRDAKEVFRVLRQVPMQHRSRVAIRDRISRDNTPVRFSGTVIRKEAQHGFVARDGSGDWVFFHSADHMEESWRTIFLRARISFEVGFSLSGVRALAIKPA